MADVRWSTYQKTDLAAVTDLFNLVEVHAGGRAVYLEYDMAEYIAADVRDPATDTTMAWASDGSLVAVGLAGTPPKGGFRMSISGTVHPAWRGRGLGRQTLAWQLERTAELHKEAGAPADWIVETTVLASDEDSPRLLRRFDLAPLRYWFEMVATTAATPVVELPEGLRPVTYTADLEDATYATHMEAFQDHWGFQRRTREQWLPLTVRSDSFLPELSVVAFDGDEPVGYVLSYKDTEAERLYIGHVGVRRNWRRRGVAAALLSQVLIAAVAKGYTTAGLGVDADSPTGAVGVYERVGFSVEHRAVTYSRPLVPSALI